MYARHVSTSFLVISLFSTVAAGQVVVLHDDFDDGSLSPAWDAIFDGANAWTFTETGTVLMVTDIGEDFIRCTGGCGAAKVILRQPVPPVVDFHLDFDFSWDNMADNKAMMRLFVTLLGPNDEVVVRTGYRDAWYLTRGDKLAVTETDSFSSGPNTLPFSGTASIDVERTNDSISIAWDGNTLLTSPSATPVQELRLEFWSTAVAPPPAGVDCGAGCEAFITAPNASRPVSVDLVRLENWGPADIPTVSFWGFAVMSLLSITAGAVVLVARRRDAT